ncbi:hypothetical protein, partial [Nocardia seriolae]
MYGDGDAGALEYRAIRRSIQISGPVMIKRELEGPGTVSSTEVSGETAGQALDGVLRVPTGLIRNCGPWAVGWFGLIGVSTATT